MEQQQLKIQNMKGTDMLPIDSLLGDVGVTWEKKLECLCHRVQLFVLEHISVPLA